MNKTYEAILNLLERYLNQGKRINQDYLHELIEAIITCENLEEYITEISKYISGKGILYFPIKNVLNLSEKILLENIYVPTSLNNEKQRIYEYLQATKLIVKEIEHAKQLKHCDNPQKKDIETELIRKSYANFIAILKNKNYNEEELNVLKMQSDTCIAYQKLAVEERLAGIASQDILVNLVEDFALNEIEFISKKEIDQILLYPYQLTRIESHNKEISPTCYYLKKLGYNKQVINAFLNESKNLNEIEKFRLGLPNDLEEKIDTKTRILALRKKGIAIPKIVC